jgi:REP element-mobilizing transposase RayT
MADLYQNKYRIPSIRLQTWDYGSNASYFITICTKNMKHFFGKVVNGKMQLSKSGELAHNCWLQIPEHFPIAQLDEFVIMPNHMHGIITINKNDANAVQPQNIAALHDASSTKKWETNKFGPQSQNLASIIRGYKIGVTKGAKLLHPDWAWLPRYYESIIRNQKSFDNIRNYIRNNPKKWAQDKFH